MMGDPRTIFQVLKECGTSRVVKHLEPERYLQSISAANELYQSNTEDSLKRKLLVFHTPRTVTAADGSTPHFSFGVPERRPYYKFMLQSSNALNDLNLASDENLIKICQGEKVIIDESKNIFPYSLAYAGFQFGQFAGQLGDGRVVNLFDIKDKNCVFQTIQLKGSGLTPYSRFADGKAVLRSSIREFVISESLHAIGIPSTRALQISSLPQTRAKRSMHEPCAIVARFSPSWLRIGNFDLFRWKKDDKGLLQLADYCISDVFDMGKDFPSSIDLNCFSNDYLQDPDEIESQETAKLFKVDDELTKYDLLFRHIVNLNAECVAYWQTYGFCNGVLNSDNTSILGLSMDFGPFGFMDKFEPKYTPNQDDVQLRYSFGNQPSVIWWNLTKLGEALVIPLGAGPKLLEKLPNTSRNEWSESEIQALSERATAIINLSGIEYKFRFTVKYASLMAQRLGLNLDIPVATNEKDVERISKKVSDFTSKIIEPLLRIINVSGVDYNTFFLDLQNYNGPFLHESGINGIDDSLLKIFFNDKQTKKINDYYSANEQHDSGETRKLIEEAEVLSLWVKDYVMMIPVPERRLEISEKMNPLFIPRNYILEEVSDSYIEDQRNAMNDPNEGLNNEKLEKLLIMATNPYDKSKWNDQLLLELQEKWTKKQNNDSLLMTQCSCSS